MDDEGSLPDAAAEFTGCSGISCRHSSIAPHRKTVDSRFKSRRHLFELEDFPDQLEAVFGRPPSDKLRRKKEASEATRLGGCSFLLFLFPAVAPLAASALHFLSSLTPHLKATIEF
jgi:hypothetical protein